MKVGHLLHGWRREKIQEKSAELGPPLTDLWHAPMKKITKTAPGPRESMERRISCVHLKPPWSDLWPWVTTFLLHEVTFTLVSPPWSPNIVCVRWGFLGEVYLFLSSLITTVEQVLLLESGELEATGALVQMGPDPLNRAQVCSPSYCLWLLV